MSESDKAQTVHVHGDMVTENTPPEGDVWYPQDPLCLRAEALVRLAAATIGVSKETREIIHGAMKAVSYTMNQVFPTMQVAHRRAVAELEAEDATKH